MEASFNVSSFVIRFIHAEPGEGGQLYRGFIRHVQSNQEINFSRWDEAEAFMQRFVPLQEDVDSITKPETGDLDS